MAEVRDIVDCRGEGAGLSDRNKWTGHYTYHLLFRTGFESLEATICDLGLKGRGLTYLVPLEFMK